MIFRVQEIREKTYADYDAFQDLKDVVRLAVPNVSMAVVTVVLKEEDPDERIFVVLATLPELQAKNVLSLLADAFLPGCTIVGFDIEIAN